MGYDYVVYANSNREQFVDCAVCNKQFSWLKAKKNDFGDFETVCRSCRIKKRTMKIKRIIHKHILKHGDYWYLCNQAVNANWKKTDLSTKKINCKNCLKQKKEF